MHCFALLICIILHNAFTDSHLPLSGVPQFRFHHPKPMKKAIVSASSLRALFVACCLCTGAAAHAHQPFQSSATVRVEGRELELKVSTSHEIAGLLIGQTGPFSGNLDPLLLQEAPSLYQVTAGTTVLQPSRTFFGSDASDAVFSLIYTLPPASEVRLRAAYLKRLPIGCGAQVQALDDTGRARGAGTVLKAGDGMDTLVIPIPATIPADGSAEPPSSLPTTDRAPAKVAAHILLTGFILLTLSAIRRLIPRLRQSPN